MKKEKENSEISQLSIATATATATTASNLKSKRLVFDRRYGWVFDDWKEPSQEALAAGRGMFCILPLAKGLIDVASHSIDMLTNLAISILEDSENLSPRQMQATIGTRFRQLTASVQKPNLSLLAFNGKPLFPSASRSLHQRNESSNLQEADIL